MACHPVGGSPQILPSRAAPLPECPVVSHPIGWEFCAGGLAALLVVAVATFIARKNAATRLPGGATFSAKDSWATDLTALIAAMGAIGAAASDKFPNTVDEQSIVEFSVGGGLLLLVAACAPIAYAALASAQPPRAGAHTISSAGTVGLVAAAFLTLTATFGSLVGVAVIAHDAHFGDASKLAVYGACGLGGALVAVYSVRTVTTLLSATCELLPTLTGMIVVSCCGPDELSRTRIALL